MRRKEELEAPPVGHGQHSGAGRLRPNFNLDIYFSSNSKNGYDHETRQEKLDRYRLKKSRRVWKKKVAYTSRQDVANHRPRVRGRFVSSKKPDFEGSPAQREETTPNIPSSPHL